MTGRATLKALVVACLAAASSLLGAPGAVADTCPTYNLPNELVLVSGTPQSAKLDTAFENLQAQFQNSNGCPVTTQLAGLAVTFAAPRSGPSGTFAASGSNAVLVGSGPDGTASASMFTANSLPGGYQVVASSQYGSVSFSLVNTASGVPAAISPISSTSQSAHVGGEYGRPLEVKVLDANGIPVPGASVTFSLGSASGGAGTTGGASTAGAAFAGGSSQATAVTDASGLATSPRFDANAVAGTFTATALTQGVTGVSSFRLDNLAGSTPTISVAGRVAHAATVGARFDKPLEVKVRGADGKSERGVTVTFILGAGASGSAAGEAGASFVGGSSQATATTNASGIATSPRFVANTVAGAFTATATSTATTEPVVTTFRNLPAKPATITAGVAATESTPTGTRFPIKLAVVVDDAHGNPVPGIVVEFTAPARGASGRFMSTHSHTVDATTDAKGVAVAPAFVANRRQGGYVVRASAAGHSAAFALVNR